MSNLRIGIYGGTFNPVHHAHLLVAQTAFEALNLSRVIFVPSGIPPLKGNRDLIDGEHRLQMVQLAIADQERFSVCDFEVRRGAQTSFTIDTVRYLVAQHSIDTEFYFILGDDCIARLPLWNGIDELRTLLQFVCVNRAGAAAAPDSPPILSVEMPTVGISSTQVRARLRERRSIRYLTPPVVAQYIAMHDLYRDPEPALEASTHA